jgi:hypothetical protein
MLCADAVRTIQSSKFNAMASDSPILQGIKIQTSDYKGRVYSDFYPAQDSIIPGWIVMGKGEEYGGMLRMICARPDVKERRYKYINGKISRGFRTRREAQAIANAMNK